MIESKKKDGSMSTAALQLRTSLRPKKRNCLFPVTVRKK